ncbi:MAG: iron-sulfur binding hydrogenase [Sphaerochaetaceae bacterium]
MVTLKELVEKLNLNVFSMENPSETINGGYTGDLLSDVMGNAKEDSIFITIQAHKNSVAVASLIGIKAILLCNGRVADNEMIEAAKEEKIGLFGTKENQFTSSYLVANLLK